MSPSYALKPGFDNLLELPRVHGKSADGFRHFFRDHRILIHLQTEGFLVEADALQIGGLSYKCFSILKCQGTDNDFDRPSGTGPLCIANQALRAWLLSACPSGTKPFFHRKAIQLS
jgi:hypothetical protein